MITLRFIIDLGCEAAFNMAADQYLLHNCKEENMLYVRFYSWKTPTITLGYMQNAGETLLFDKLKRDSIHWIRRPTGGRAVLHWEDLTYSCIFPKTFSMMGSSVRESYAIITRCLIDGLCRAGIECQTHDSYDQLLAVKREIKLPCFLAPNRDEIMVKGRKFVGSAQKRSIEGTLQHGSLPVSSKFSNLPEYLNISTDEQKTQMLLLQAKSVCLQEIRPGISLETLIESLRGGFSNTLKMQSTVTNWSDKELCDIKRIACSEEFIETWASPPAPLWS
jgi:lipoate-protein ligase A